MASRIDEPPHAGLADELVAYQGDGAAVDDRVGFDSCCVDQILARGEVGCLVDEVL
ncbi:hypothetical protein [Nocardia sp. NPDC058480]|uniref:hypothetical protein n=1 Tax=unclassified Nocardia TaxID=2637762 RepID=UPI0036575BF6